MPATCRAMTAADVCASPALDLSAIRDLLHHLADLLADALAIRASANPVALPPRGRERPTRPAASERAKRRAPRMPPVIEKRLEVSRENHERARQALLRRGIAVPREEQCP
jgi:hypothetical protein